MTATNTQAPTDQADRQAMVSRLCAELRHLDRIGKDHSLSAETVKALECLSEAMLAGIVALQREGAR